jgi:diaminohydroxyphosphoribosylaminopyrimidine deaminase/5-amino-6-(5-phosphoribosylamino)uracil reductase
MVHGYGVSDNDKKWMAQAVAEAAKGLGLTAPNPPVGAVVVRDGKVLGRGWHQRAGGPHAERVALADAEARHGGGAARGTTVYVTLEPCCTTGRTPPCTDALIDHRVARVVYALVDPNPSHAGRADALLAAAGIAVTRGVGANDAADLLHGFTSAMRRGRPWVIAKAAMGLDGAITRPDGESPWLTGPESLAEVQRWRSTVDAILTSGETVRRDNPALTLRIPHPHGDKPTPWRVIATRSGELPIDARVFTDAQAGRTIVLLLGKADAPADLPAAVHRLRAGSWLDALRQLTVHFDVHRMLVEAGGVMLGSLFDARLIDEWLGWFAPRLCGTGKPGLAGLGYANPPGAARLGGVTHERFGDDVLVRGRVTYPDPEPRILRPAVFFDRDGVVNDPGANYYVTCPEDFHFCEGIHAALAATKAAGYAPVLLTSPRGVGKGLMTLDDLDRIHTGMQAELAIHGLAFDAIHAYTGQSADGPGAKPDPHFIHLAAESLGLDLAGSWVVGDADRDIAMGHRAGLRTIRVRGEKPIGVHATHTVGAVRDLAPLLERVLA